MKQHNRKNDILLIVGILLIGAVIAAAVLLTEKNGSFVQVSVDGNIIASYSLYSEMETDIKGIGGTNHLVISGGQAWIENADCPDCLCVKMGKICKTGQSVICLPHRIVVQISGNIQDNNYPDIIVR